MDHSQHHNQPEAPHACCATKQKRDWFLVVSLTIVALGYGYYLLGMDVHPLLAVFTDSIFALMNKMWWGILLGVFFVGLLGRIPRAFIISVLGKGGTFSGILRATAAGVMLDLCSHGILLVGMQLYKRGASLGQLMAFLIASPWNSFSLTLIMWGLIGFKWMIAFLLLSLVIAIISGYIFDRLVARGTLPANPNTFDLPEGFRFWKEAKLGIKKTNLSPREIIAMLREGLRDSIMILKWIFFGIVLASAIRTFVDPSTFSTFFGPTLMGLGATLIFATILEVCSEGSMPIATDLLTRAGAPGNSFAFLMTGIATDYTEIMSIKETTGHWKISLFLPLITVPQVVLIAIILNGV